MNMTVELHKMIQELRKIPLIGLCMFVIIVFSAFIFLPDIVIQKLGLAGVKSKIIPWISIVYLLVIGLFLVLVSYRLVKYCLDKIHTENSRKTKLNLLSKDAKKVLRTIYESDTHSISLALTSSISAELADAQVVNKAPVSSSIIFEHYLQPWVVQYLDKHSDYAENVPLGGKNVLDRLNNDEWY